MQRDQSGQRTANETHIKGQQQEYQQSRQQQYYPYHNEQQQFKHQTQQSQQQQNGSMQIKNSQTGQLSRVKGPEMNDRDRLNDMLATEKYLTDNYNVFAREASHRSLYQDVQQIHSQTHQEIRGLFNLMFEKGWYTLQAESTQQVSQAHQQFSDYQTQFASSQQQGYGQQGYRQS